VKTMADPEYSLTDVGVRLESSAGPIDILENVTFGVGDGEILGIVGRSGVGKTTLLRLLAGLVVPSSGEITFEGRTFSRPPERVVTVFQDYGNALLPWRTVERNVRLGLERHLRGAELATRVNEALSMVGLEDRRGDYPWRLSGGMQQRVQIARALAMRPRVLLMDEPFGALDAMTRAFLQDELLRVHKETGATIIFITHDLEEAIYLSDRVLVMSGPPGTISQSEEIRLPRPRDQLTTREQPEYLSVRHRLGVAIHAEQAQ
jgi:NitT/TauT family transport system ATP-binding protein